MVKASAVRDDHGQVVMAINIFEDITEHKRSELEQQFLSRSSRVLAASLDPDDTLRRVAELTVQYAANAAQGLLGGAHPQLFALLTRLHARPGYQAALAKGGPYAYAKEGG